MQAFAARTGIDPPHDSDTRYLWTDAFAVCNFLTLARATSDPIYLAHAKNLIEQVHHVLGRHRRDDSRRGWISGLEEEDALRHPTCGGLRIGKPLNERQPDEPLDEQLEWERDGQYFHYLTKWMHALHRTALATSQEEYLIWALELALAAHRSFVHVSDQGEQRLYWKMSIDLSRPLVCSMGAMDSLDGFVVLCTIQGERPEVDSPEKAILLSAIEDMQTMCESAQWTTVDALGIGGLLCDAAGLVRLIARGTLAHTRILDKALFSAADSLHSFRSFNRLDSSPEHRLAFRELGLSIGLHTLRQMHDQIADNHRRFHQGKVLLSLLASLARHTPLIEQIEQFWLRPESQQSLTWTQHQDINAVMLATSLASSAYMANVET